MLTFAISSLPFASLFPPHQCRMLPNGANSLFKSTPSPTAARHMRPPGVELGAQAWEACMLPLYYGRHDTSQETRQWLLAIAPLPFLLSLSQTTQRCSQTSDSEGIRTPAGRAQWMSGPSPWPLGHTVMLVPASHIHLKIYASIGPIAKIAKQTRMRDKVHLHQPRMEPGSDRWQRCILPLDH